MLNLTISSFSMIMWPALSLSTFVSMFVNRKFLHAKMAEATEASTKRYAIDESQNLCS